MRSSIYQRRARANNLRISVANNTQNPIDIDSDSDSVSDPDSDIDSVSDPESDVDSISDPDSNSEDEGGLDSPSPTSPNFPDGTSTSIAPGPTQTIGARSQLSQARVSRRGTLYQRRARADNFRISVRDEAQDPVDIDSDSGSDSDSEDEGEPDSPSPTSPNFPAGTSTSISSGPTQTVGAGVQTDSNIVGGNNELSQAQVSDGGNDNDMPGMSKAGAIAFGTIGGVVIVAALIFIVWKFSRRRTQTNTKRGLFTKFTPSRFGRTEEPQKPQGTREFGHQRSRTMDDLMAAAYAAEDGNISQYGSYADEKQQLNAYVYATPPMSQQIPMQQSNAPDQRASTNTSNSIYVNQLMSGFYKGGRSDGLAMPANARMPPPAAPSVAGQTEVTNTTESTWKTWGWSQPKKPKEPKETWVDKCVRLGGLR